MAIGTLSAIGEQNATPESSDVYLHTFVTEFENLENYDFYINWCSNTDAPMTSLEDIYNYVSDNNYVLSKPMYIYIWCYRINYGTYVFYAIDVENGKLNMRGMYSNNFQFTQSQCASARLSDYHVYKIT